MPQSLNHLGKAIEDTRLNASLDSSIKRLLANKQILARILKEVLTECKDLSVEQIIPLIDKTAVEEIPLEPGSVNDLVTGLPQESTVTGESRITYDIRFNVTIPAKHRYTMVIDVEVQGDPYPGYPIPVRGFVHCSRMISDQLGNVVKHEEFEKLRKVVSIWIVLNTAQKDANCIVWYETSPIAQTGYYTKDPDVGYERVVIIHLPKDDEWEKAKNKATPLTRMLSILLSNSISPQDKMHLLKEEYDIETTEDLKEEVENMSSVSAYMQKEMRREIRKEIKKENEIEKQKAITETKAASAEETIKRMILSNETDDRKIAFYADSTVETVEKLRALLKK